MGTTFNINWRLDSSSAAKRGQALNHKDPGTYALYQSGIVQLNVQACYWNQDPVPDNECLEMQQSMSRHRDPNAPQHLDAAATLHFGEGHKRHKVIGNHCEFMSINREPEVRVHGGVDEPDAISLSGSEECFKVTAHRCPVLSTQTFIPLSSPPCICGVP